MSILIRCVDFDLDTKDVFDGKPVELDIGDEWVVFDVQRMASAREDRTWLRVWFRERGLSYSDVDHIVASYTPVDDY